MTTETALEEIRRTAILLIDARLDGRMGNRQLEYALRQLTAGLPSPPNDLCRCGCHVWAWDWAREEGIANACEHCIGEGSA